MSEKKGKSSGRECPVCGIFVVAPEERFMLHLQWEEKEDERIKKGKKEQTPGLYVNPKEK